MKKFFTRYSYDSVRMLLDQIVISIFGFALAMTAVQIKSDALLAASSVGAIVFYLVLIYGVAWKVGQQDRKNYNSYGESHHPLTGMLVSLLANSINFLVAIVVAISTFVGAEGVASLGRGTALLGQGMYQGLLAVLTLGGQELNDHWWVYLLLPIPSMLISHIAYTMGVRDRVLSKMAIPDLPASDRPTKQEKREQKRAEKNNRGE